MEPLTFPKSLPEFMKVFPNDQACRDYLERLKWPDGFVCPQCGVKGAPYRVATRPGVLKCGNCHMNHGLTSGTVMHASRTPLSTWFWGAYLITTNTPGYSALQFQRQLGLTRYETAYQILQKLRAGMVRPERDCIGGEHLVEVDECLVGGKTRGEGRGVHHKTLVVGAVEVRVREDAEEREAKWEAKHHKKGIPIKKLVYAGRIRLRVVENRSADELTKFVTENVKPDTMVRTDGLLSYDGLTKAGFVHDGLALNGDPDKAEGHLPMIHLIFSNLKTWLQGTHHGVSAQHLQGYLNEYVFRFNRRFYPMNAFHSILGLASKAVSPTYKQLYSGEWKHHA